jgi:hypothetical protein
VLKLSHNGKVCANEESLLNIICKTPKAQNVIGAGKDYTPPTPNLAVLISPSP